MCCSHQSRCCVCHQVLLAGGFACSPYLQRRVLREVAGALGPPGAHPLPLLLPENAAAAVVTGASGWVWHNWVGGKD